MILAVPPAPPLGSRSACPRERDGYASLARTGRVRAAATTTVAVTVGLVRCLLPVDPLGSDAAAERPEAGDVDLDALYAIPPLAPGAWHVRSNFVASADGAAEVDGRSGGLAGSADRRVFRTLRWLSDVVLVGAGTARDENYGPVVVPPDRREMRVAAGLAPVPPVAVVTRSLDVDPAARLFAAEVRPVLLTCETAPEARRRALAEVADVRVCGEDAVDPRAALAVLTDRGWTRILTEGGPMLHATLAADGLLDELCLTIAPLLGGPGHRGIVRGTRWPGTLGLTLVHVLEEDGTLFLRYRR
jgi:riboflavin biosynthesis pyrimidine reductase